MAHWRFYIPFGLRPAFLHQEKEDEISKVKQEKEEFPLIKLLRLKILSWRNTIGTMLIFGLSIIQLSECQVGHLSRENGRPLISKV